MQIAVDRSTPKTSQSATCTSRARSPVPPLVQRRTTPPARPPAESTRAALEQAFGAEVFAAAATGRTRAVGDRVTQEILGAPGGSPIQAKAAGPGVGTGSGPDRAVNSTGIPSPVKAKMEAAFGADFSGVRVHPSSSRAVALGALAYTQGSEIHVAPGRWAPETRHGQELLGHELAHVVQQRAGRVQATAQYKGIGLNDAPALEAEADTLGARAAAGAVAIHDGSPVGLDNSGVHVIQRKTEVTWTKQRFEYNDVSGQPASQVVGKKMVANLDPADPRTGNHTTSREMEDLFEGLKATWDPGSKGWVRGHLLNDNLGGPDVDTNLFPITGHANGEHEREVESHVKAWVSAKRLCCYSVEALQDRGNEGSLRRAGGRLVCYAETKDGGPRLVVNKTIYSKPTPIPNQAPSGWHFSGVDTHDNNWIWPNNTENGRGPKGIRGLPRPAKGMGRSALAAWETQHATKRWFFGPDYQM